MKLLTVLTLAAIAAGAMTLDALAQSIPTDPQMQGLTVTSCTGYLYGNASAPVTCATAVPAANVSGLPTYANVTQTQYAAIGGM